MAFGGMRLATNGLFERLDDSSPRFFIQGLELSHHFGFRFFALEGRDVNRQTASHKISREGLSQVFSIRRPDSRPRPNLLSHTANEVERQTSDFTKTDNGYLLLPLIVIAFSDHVIARQMTSPAFVFTIT